MQPLIPNLHPKSCHGAAVFNDLTRRLQEGRSPEALLLKGALLGKAPQFLAHMAAKGELLTMQTLGAMVPAYEANAPFSEYAGLEEAVVAHGIKHLIVCGHTPSRIILELVKHGVLNQSAGLSLVPPLWYQLAQPTIHLLKTHYASYPLETLVDVAVQEHTLVQLDQLMSYPFIAQRVLSGALNLHAWLYDTKQQHLYTYRPAAQQFYPFTLDTRPQKNTTVVHMPKRYR
ncbi:MAG: hypothetical protein KC475_09285 [Cyanobacteria bacterium HKST-UBA03]|nr:hypothetical protein [Cyanobacteria bacterium HKST-UBA03]